MCVVPPLVKEAIVRYACKSSNLQVVGFHAACIRNKQPNWGKTEAFADCTTAKVNLLDIPINLRVTIIIYTCTIIPATLNTKVEELVYRGRLFIIDRAFIAFERKTKLR